MGFSWDFVALLPSIGDQRGVTGSLGGEMADSNLGRGTQLGCERGGSGRQPS